VSRLGLTVIAAAFVGALFPSVLLAAAPAAVEDGPIVLRRGEGTVFPLPRAAHIVAISDAKRADVELGPRSSSVFLYGKKDGDVTLHVEDDKGEVLLNTLIYIGR